MNTLLLSDFHLDNVNPASWLKSESYAKWSIDKLKHVLELAKKHGCSSVMIPGDFLHRRNISYKLCNEIRDVIMEDEGIKFYTCLGQHDVGGRNSTNVKDSAISLTGINILSGDYFEDAFSGYSFGDDDTIALIEGIDVDVTKVSHKEVVMIHASIGEHNVTRTIDKIATLFDRKLKQDAWPRVLLFGDIHPGFRPYDLGYGCQAMNLGSWSRNTANERWDLQYGVLGPTGNATLMPLEPPMNDLKYDPVYIEQLEAEASKRENIDTHGASVALGKLRHRAGIPLQERLMGMATTLGYDATVVQRVMESTDVK